MDHSDMIALPLLSTERLDAFSVGSEYTRVEKTLRVAEIPDSFDTIDVCKTPKNSTNCSACSKCMRTLLTLDIAGVIEKYAASFNLDAYKKRRLVYIGKVIGYRDPLLHEIIRFAAARGYAFPFISYAYSPIFRFADQIKRLSKKIRGR